jgi:hypothetical protein
MLAAAVLAAVVALVVVFRRDAKYGLLLLPVAYAANFPGWSERFTPAGRGGLRRK